MSAEFDYHTAFSRNIGWVSKAEQEVLRHKRIAIAGLGGVGGDHLVTLARMGVGSFNIADMDVFELANFNRQFGATLKTIGQEKAEVMRGVVESINPEGGNRVFPAGINPDNLDDFLQGVDLYMDSLDFYALDIRRDVFRACYERNIPAVTAAPLGMGTALLVFMPGRMSFEEYFDFAAAKTWDDSMTKFLIGLSPSMMQMKYLIRESSLDFEERKGPSTPMGISLAAGVAGSAAVKILLGRGEIVCAPRGLHFDAYRNRMRITWRPGGNRNPLQRLMFTMAKSMIAKQKKAG
ncbi:MAG: ThiF family adenylyltransferase [Halieaceae bacterium]|nr:ThiF family adenylyltransferase [Halieaceae bacterium]